MIDLTDSQIGQLDGSNCPSTPRGLSSPASEKYVLRQANFRDKPNSRTSQNSVKRKFNFGEFPFSALR
jgi:hypothetical protein